MSKQFDTLPDKDKLILCIDYKARNTALPEALRTFLIQRGLYELITNPNGATI